MLPKNKQKKYTLTLVNKTGYSRSALGVKHTDIECSHYSIFSLNMRIMAIGLNVIRDNSKKILQQLLYRQGKSLLLK